MGHAGAIVGGKDDTASAKMKIMDNCGINVVESPASIGETMKKNIELIMKLLNNKIALITGGSRGIGKSIVFKIC